AVAQRVDVAIDALDETGARRVGALALPLARDVVGEPAQRFGIGVEERLLPGHELQVLLQLVQRDLERRRGLPAALALAAAVAAARAAAPAAAAELGEGALGDQRAAEEREQRALIHRRAGARPARAGRPTGGCRPAAWPARAAPIRPAVPASALLPAHAPCRYSAARSRRATRAPHAPRAPSPAARAPRAPARRRSGTPPAAAPS